MLTLRKDVDPGSTGDDTAATAWHLSATPSPAIADQGVVEGDGSVTETVRIGTYLLAEDGPEHLRGRRGRLGVHRRRRRRRRGHGREGHHAARRPRDLRDHQPRGPERLAGHQDQPDQPRAPSTRATPSSTSSRPSGSAAAWTSVTSTSPTTWSTCSAGGRATFDTGSALSSTAGTVTEPTAGSTDLVWHLDRLHDTATLDYSVTVGDVFGAVLRNAATPGSEPCVDPDPTDAVECDSTTHYTTALHAGQGRRLRRPGRRRDGEPGSGPDLHAHRPQRHPARGRERRGRVRRPERRPARRGDDLDERRARRPGPGAQGSGGRRAPRVDRARSGRARGLRQRVVRRHDRRPRLGPEPAQRGHPAGRRGRLRPVHDDHRDPAGHHAGGQEGRHGGRRRGARRPARCGVRALPRPRHRGLAGRRRRAGPAAGRPGR